MKKIIVISICLVIGILVYKKSDEIIIPGDAIRIRIIANSNSIEDLYAKKVLKEEIKKDLYNLVKEAKSSNEAGQIIKNNMDKIKELINSKTDNAVIEYGFNHFPQKVYKKVVYPEGEYESLVITLGKGLGDNWWCVLYPPLCLIEDSNTSTDVEYQFMIKKILNID